MDILEELQERKILKDITNKEKFKKIKKGSGVYIGFDPTAESLHLGNYVQIALLLRMKKAGYRAIAILGGATGMIGDPSGKSEERKLLDIKTLTKNKNKIKKQLEYFGLEVFDNNNFYKNMNFLRFIREIGKKININYMINKEIVSSRLEGGISFTEFTYQLIQGYDFYKLYKDHEVYIQMGGSDQWGNITTGIEIIRKMVGDKNLATGIITNLMTTSSGKKFGKSEDNAIWIDKNMTSPYALYQYMLNTNDNDLKTIFNWLTFLTKNEIKNILNVHKKNMSQKHGQKKLAKIIVTNIHSENDYHNATKLTNVLFGNGDVKKLSLSQVMSLKNSIPTTNENGKDIQDFLVNNKITSSRRETREAIKNGSIQINGEKIIDVNFIYKHKEFSGQVSIIKKGKRKFFLVLKS